MRRIFEQAPTLVGHRGLGTGTVDGEAENTISSYLAAVGTGLTWVELDVRRSSDDQLVLLHNSALPDGRFVIDIPAAETGLPYLGDVLDALPEGIGVNIDVKTEFEDALDPRQRRTTALLGPVLDAERHRRPLVVEAFDPAALLDLRERVPDVPLALMMWIRFPLQFAVPAAANLGVDALCLNTQSFALDRDPAQVPARRPPEYAIETAHKAGLEVMVWCPEPDESRWFADAGTDALIVNDPAAVLAALTPAG